MADTLKARITEAMKNAMRAQEKQRLSAIRMVLADIKRIEVDERIEVDDARVLAILDKVCKQRRDSIAAFQAAGRTELADNETFELNVISEFLPQQLTETEIADLIAKAVAETGAAGPSGMGKVMAILKPQIQGRADMAAVSKLVKAQLG